MDEEVFQLTGQDRRRAVEDTRMRMTFTGTRSGMTPKQLSKVMESFRSLRTASELQILIHGACHGADREAHKLVTHRIMYPCNTEQAIWAMAAKKDGDIVYPIISDSIKRNHVMVDEGNVVVAAPATKTEIFRGSGTWATIRYARKCQKRLIICWHDGTVTEER